VHYAIKQTGEVKMREKIVRTYEFPKMNVTTANTATPANAAPSPAPATMPQALKVKRLVQDLLARSQLESQLKASVDERMDVLQAIASLEPVIEASLRNKK